MSSTLNAPLGLPASPANSWAREVSDTPTAASAVEARKLLRSKGDDEDENDKHRFIALSAGMNYLPAPETATLLIHVFHRTTTDFWPNVFHVTCMGRCPHTAAGTILNESKNGHRIR